MATTPGKPSITTPGAADRATQAAINNIRERLRQLDVALAGLQTSGRTDTTALQRTVDGLSRTVAALSNQVAAAAPGAATATDDSIRLLIPSPEPAPRDDSQRLFTPPEAPPAPDVNEVSAILAARVFSGA